MSHYLRPHKGEHGKLLAVPGTMIHERPFIMSAHLAMHDECAKRELGPELHPWSPGREGFSEIAGQPLCWSPGSYSAENTVPCYWCGEGV